MTSPNFDTAWEAFRAAYFEYQDLNENWKVFWTDHHAYALNAGLLALDGAAPVEPDGAALIAAERRRVVTAEGRTPEHDDQHVHGELLDAARCYANQGATYFAEHINAYGTDSYSMYDQNWPWWTGDEPAGWKPSSNPVRNLVKAGQFIAAEIDRLQRAERGDLS